MSRVAEGHFRRKREAPLILRGKHVTIQGHPRPEPGHAFCTFHRLPRPSNPKKGD
jgi:hypothetical protein